MFCFFVDDYVYTYMCAYHNSVKEPLVHTFNINIHYYLINKILD